MDRFLNRLKDGLISTGRFVKNQFVPGPITTEGGSLVTPPKPILPYILLALAGMVYISARVTEYSTAVLVERLFDFQLGPVGFIRRFFPVNWSYWREVLDPIYETVQMSFLGSFIGSLLALPVAYLSSKNITKNAWVVNTLRTLLSVLRTIPILIYALFLVYVFYLGVLPGTIAIAIFTFGIVSKMLYERIETLDMQAFYAIEATGATKVQAFVTALMPEVAPIFYSLSLYAFEINIRYAAILGYVGAGGIGFILDNAMKNVRHNDRIIVILIFIFITVVIIENTSRYLRRRLG